MIRISISEEDNLMFERANYEFAGLLTLLTQFTSDTELKPDDERFEFLLDKYLESYAAYNIIFGAIFHKYVHDDKVLMQNMSPNFNTSEIIILEEEDVNGKMCCSCGH